MRQGDQIRNVVLALTHLASFGVEGNEELIKSIVANGNPDELEAVAFISSLSDEMFHTLSVNRAAKVRAALAANRCCPMDVLLLLAKDSAVTVKRAADESLEQFASRPKVGVRSGGSRVDEMMEEFALQMDPGKIDSLCNSDVAALFGESFLGKMIDYPRIKELSGSAIYKYVATLPNREAALASLSPLLSNSQIGEILTQYARYEYGRNSYTNEELFGPFVSRVDVEFIREIGASDSNYLRRIAARSELLEAARVDELALKDNSSEVVTAARRNPKISRAALLESCLRDRNVPDRGDIADYVGRFGDSFLDDLLDHGSAVAVAYAMHYKVGTAKYSLRKVLSIAARSADDKVRLAAVKMEEMGPNALKRLIYDPSMGVRTEALKHRSTRVEDLIAYSLKHKLTWSNMVRFSDEELMQVGADSAFSALTAGNLNSDGGVSTGTVLRSRLARLIFGRIKASGLDRPEVIALLIGLADGYSGSIGELLDSVASLSS